jgi:uncharacterized DUF497 family protein
MGYTNVEDCNMFYGDDFDWDDDNVEHIARHRVAPWEAEEAALDPEGVTIRGGRSGRVAVIGMTEAGRVLVVALDRGDRGVWCVVTARNASQNEKRLYRRRRR